jgi:hypothetical protein
MGQRIRMLPLKGSRASRGCAPTGLRWASRQDGAPGEGPVRTPGRRGLPAPRSTKAIRLGDEAVRQADPHGVARAATLRPQHDSEMCLPLTVSGHPADARRPVHGRHRRTHGAHVRGGRRLVEAAATAASHATKPARPRLSQNLRDPRRGYSKRLALTTGLMAAPARLVRHGDAVGLRTSPGRAGLGSTALEPGRSCRHAGRAARSDVSGHSCSAMTVAPAGRRLADRAGGRWSPGAGSLKPPSLRRVTIWPVQPRGGRIPLVRRWRQCRG